MSQIPHHAESTGSGAVLYMALELSARWWQLAFGLGLATPSRRRTIAAGDEEGLRREIVAALQRFGLSAATPVRSSSFCSSKNSGGRSGIQSSGAFPAR